jgi:hypothetical protein
MGLSSPPLWLLIWYRLAFAAKFGNDPPDKGSRIIQVAHHIQEAFVIKAESGKLLDHFNR